MLPKAADKVLRRARGAIVVEVILRSDRSDVRGLGLYQVDSLGLDGPEISRGHQSKQHNGDIRNACARSGAQSLYNRIDHIPDDHCEHGASSLAVPGQ